MTRDLKPGLVTLAEAKANREWFEAARESVVVPPGDYQLDRAPWLTGPLQIDGQGAKIDNVHHGSTFPLNSTLVIRGTGVGHVDKMVSSGANCLLEEAAAAPNYQPGRTVYAFRNEAYGVVCQRRIVVSVSGRSVRLSDTIDSRCNAMTWIARSTFATDTVKRSDSVCYVGNPAGMTAGGYVFLTSGPSVANEMRGEFLQVKSISGRQVNFVRGATREYTQPTLCLLSEAQNITIRDVHFAQPVHPQAACVMVTHARGIRLERCTFDGFIGTGQCTDLDLIDCTFRHAVALNTTTRARIIGCVSHGHGIHTDEADAEITVEDWVCLNPVEAAIRTGLEPSGVHVRNAVIVNSNTSPILCIGATADSSFEKWNIVGPAPACYLRGHRLRVDDFRTTGDVVVCDGDNQLLRHVECNELHLGHTVGGPSNGRAVSCRARIVQQPTGVGWLVN